MQGLVVITRVKIICPGCGQTVESVAHDGVVKGYCAVAQKVVEVVAPR